MCISHTDPETELPSFEMIAEQRAAGAILIPFFTDSSRLRQLRAVGTQLVLIDRLAENGEGCSVVMDDVLGGRLATEPLLRDGTAAGIVIVSGPESVPQCFDRRAGAPAALTAAGSAPESLTAPCASSAPMTNLPSG